ncbi:DUF6497 family protein [Ascidiaceihabitans sp.]|nr:DUF6497 family protein [Ascidiaceihabitans sp.]|tara:strand:+ start:294 stop:701 length:408 start_codon:yes stop_codon:yes gene_type:complete
MSVLRRYCVGAIAVTFVYSLPLYATVQEVPSSQSVTLHEVLVDMVNGENWLRFRFVAPSIGADKGKVSHDDAAKDIEHLCAAVAVPYIAEYDLKSDLVVVSMADQKTEFGETNPDATQLFEAFSVQNDICIWEAF